MHRYDPARPEGKLGDQWAILVRPWVFGDLLLPPERLDHVKATEKHDQLKADLGLIERMIRRMQTLGDQGADAGLFEPDERDLLSLGISRDPTFDDMIDRPLARTITNDLIKMRQQVRSALQRTEPKPLPANRPPVEWKRWFARRIGDLWLDLTGEKPAPTGTKFPEFLKACWESLGDEMPNEDFSHVLREYATELLEAAGELRKAG